MQRRRAWLPSIALACAAFACARVDDLRPRTPSTRAPAVIDMHVDLGAALSSDARAMDHDAFEASFLRLASGGVDTVVASLFVPHARELSAVRVRTAYDEERARVVRAFQAKSGAPRLVLALEGADGFADDAAGIAPYVRGGVCVIALVHDRTNALAGSSTEPHSADRIGLTDAGRRVARAALEAGALLDVAHASDAAFDDLAALASEHAAPLVASHTGMRALRDTPRDLDDARARAIGASGGVVAIDLHSGHVGAVPGDHATLDDVVRHIVRAVTVSGIDHVAIGSDLAGNADLPRGVEGADVWPRIAERLAAAGFDADAIAAVMGGNARRVLAWSHAHGCGDALRE
jgi:membrane dipeptidase